MRGLVRFPAALLLALLALSCAGSPDDDAGGGAGPAVLAALNPGTLPALRDSFNAAADRPRVLVMLSPT